MDFYNVFLISSLNCHINIFSMSSLCLILYVVSIYYSLSLLYVCVKFNMYINNSYPNYLNNYNVKTMSHIFYLRSAIVVSNSWNASASVIADIAASLFSSGRSTTPGRKAILILTNASLQSASRYLALRE